MRFVLSAQRFRDALDYALLSRNHQCPEIGSDRGREAQSRGSFRRPGDFVGETANGTEDIRWIDDGDDVMEPPESSDDRYFLCPLLPPGRTNP